MPNTITIINRQSINGDEQAEYLLRATCGRALLNLNQDGQRATIHVAPRANTGWLEFLLIIEYAEENRNKLVIGCIQRKPQPRWTTPYDSSFEFHS